MSDLNTDDVVIIHAGMHKTGSSSIQETLLWAEKNGKLCSDIPTKYFSLGSSNHSGNLQKAYSPTIADNFLHVVNGTDTKENFLKTGLMRRSQFRRFFNNRERCIISGEGIVRLSYEDLLNLRSDIYEVKKRVVVVVYIREPASFMGSAYQQRLQVMLPVLVSQGIYPNYRKRFLNLEKVFGTENVLYFPFSAEKLKAGNVVLDFLSRLNIPIEESAIVQQNEGLSASAVALLWCYRNVYGQSIGAEDVSFDGKMVNELRRLPGKKFAMGETAARLILGNNVEDMEWIRSRVKLSEPIFDNPKKRYFNNNDEIITCALNSIDKARSLLNLSHHGDINGPEKIAKLLRSHFFRKRQKSLIPDQ